MSPERTTNRRGSVFEHLIGHAAQVLGTQSARLFVLDVGKPTRLMLVATHGRPTTPDAVAAALAARAVGLAADGACSPVALLHGTNAAVVAAIVADDPRPPDPEAWRRFAALAGSTLEAATSRMVLAGRAAEVAGTCRSLETVAGIEQQLGSLVGTGAGAAGIVAAAARLAGKVVAFYLGNESRPVAYGADGRPEPVVPVRALLAAAGLGALTKPGPIPVIARPSVGLDSGALLMRVQIRGERLGWLAVFERPSGLTPLDRLVARRAASFLARETTVQRRIDNVRASALSSLARQLIRGTRDMTDLRESASHLGIDHESRRVLIHLLWQEGQRPDYAAINEVCAELHARLDVEVIGSRAQGAMILLVAAPSDRTPMEFVGAVKPALRELTVPGADTPTAGVSSVSEPGMLRRAFREAREVVRCIDRFRAAGGERVLAVDDLGPARLFVANTEANSLRTHVEDTLGPLLAGAPGSADLIRTLSSFLDNGRSVRACAHQLGVHENTIRLRLARIHMMTGLDIASDPNDQVSAQIALLLLRLQGHPVLRSFDEAVAARMQPA